MSVVALAVLLYEVLVLCNGVEQAGTPSISCSTAPGAVLWFLLFHVAGLVPR